uniref:Uncharacterized protein n=1 Tax=Cucumis melo TaxID=3656 RepID=A0A9I9CP70_CUCME
MAIQSFDRTWEIEKYRRKNHSTNKFPRSPALMGVFYGGEENKWGKGKCKP